MSVGGSHFGENVVGLVENSCSVAPATGPTNASIPGGCARFVNLVNAVPTSKEYYNTQKPHGLIENDSL